LAYTLKWLGEGSGTTYELLIQTPRARRSGADVEGGTRSASNVLTVKSMLQHLDAVRAATTLSVELFDVYVPAFTIIITRLPSNLRRDHPQMHAFSYPWSLPVT